MALAKTRRYGGARRGSGETPHSATSGRGGQRPALAGIETVVSFELLTCDTAEQAEARVAAPGLPAPPSRWPTPSAASNRGRRG
jgi:hypothetical protein